MQLFEILDVVHGYWAYLVLLVLILAAVNALVKYSGNRSFTDKDFRISLFALITMHIQFLLGVILFFAHPLRGFGAWSNPEITTAEIMGDSFHRLFAVEHPLVMLIAIILITIGYSKHKKELTSKGKFKKLAVFYTIGLVLVLSRIPWKHWLFE